jgi:HAD superfamily phosphatase (TIGR01668 family)
VLSPDYYYHSVHDIDLAELKSRGINTILVDLDNTLLPRDTNVVPDGLKAWSQDLERAGFKVCLVSNNWHGRVYAVASELGFELVAKALKPLPFAFLRALRVVGSSRRNAVIVGDQIFTDVLGGKILGVVTVLVEPLSPTDLPHTLLLRYAERLLLAGRKPVP